jgi:poly(3-hydroxybutyrate) depolymerase
VTDRAKVRVKTDNAAIQPEAEYSVPWFWPYAAAIELGEEGLEIFGENLKFVGEAGEISAPPRSTWATDNEVVLDLDTMRLRDFSEKGASGVPVFIDPPYAGHSSTITD